MEVLDLNILLLRRFARQADRAGPTLGDHGKDRSGVSAAARWLFTQTGLYDTPPLHLPDTADPVAGMHYPLEAVTAAVSGAVGSWREWLEQQLRACCDRPPTMVGVSLMGPSQVFVGLLVLRVAKAIWPGTTTVLGGSHVTLLADEIERDQRRSVLADLMLTGHCEDDFVTTLADLDPPGVQRPPAPAPDRPEGPFEYLPTFSERQLAHCGPSPRHCSRSR
ncbi:MULTISPECIES: hypothetical protein [Micromonospora]|uniref:hypothetical protein n=1 Tax=Micromonospora TaxID=1873 RepID=UPI001112E2A9|nr:hypothetical protein [Micromonospora yangpuensis]GGM24659.1 hypothetical protein GCM10012279_48840 [Micromonospora yangpuensis]